MSDLFYLNARLRAMRGRLLAWADYEKLLASPGLSDIAVALRETPYGAFLESFRGDAAGVGKVDEALRWNFQATLSGLISLSGEETGEGIRLLLESWELQAIKAILRGKAAGLSAGEILETTVPTGLHEDAALQELCRQPNVRAVVDLLTTWRDPWGNPLSRAMKEFREPRDLFVLETALDRFRTGRAAERLREIRRPGRGDETEDALSLFLALSVDRANLSTALKALEDRIPAAECRRYYQPGGRIYGEKDFDRILSSKSVPEALGRAARSFFARELKEVSSLSSAVPLLVAVELQLDRALRRAMNSPIRRDPLGWGPLTGYLLDKSAEIRNVRMICRGRRAGITDSDLRGLLIFEE